MATFLVSSKAVSYSSDAFKFTSFDPFWVSNSSYFKPKASTSNLNLSLPIISSRYSSIPGLSGLFDLGYIWEMLSTSPYKIKNLKLMHITYYS